MKQPTKAAGSKKAGAKKAKKATAAKPKKSAKINLRLMKIDDLGRVITKKKGAIPALQESTQIAECTYLIDCPPPNTICECPPLNTNCK